MKKFIVTSEGRLKFGDVTLHKYLLSQNEQCIGGGIYEFDFVSNRMLLSGKSYDFGRVKWAWIDTLLIPTSLVGINIYYEDIPITDFTNVRFCD